MSNVDAKTTPIVSIRPSFATGSNWVTVPYLWPDRWKNSAAPSVDVANLTYNFGVIKRADEEAARRFGPLEDLEGQYVRIETVYQRDRQTHFVGVIETVDTRIMSNQNATGKQMLTAYGLGHILDRIPVKTAFAQSTFAGPIAELDWTPSFNRRGRNGFGVFGNKSSTPIGAGSSFVFEWLSNPSSSEWTNRDIVRYLLINYTPPDLAMFVDGQDGELDKIVDVHDASKWRSIWDALNRLIDRKRGLGFRIEHNQELNTNRVKVFTIAKDDIAVGSVTMAKNDNQVDFTLPESLPFVHIVDEIPFKETILSKATKVVVRGQRVKATGTFSFDDGTLEEGWRTIGQDLPEDRYIAGKDALSSTAPSTQRDKDTNRRQQHHGGLWSRLVVPPTFDWRVGDGLAGTSTRAEPLAITPFDDGSFDTTTVGATWRGNKRFLRTTPFLVGWEYSISPPNPYAATDRSHPEYEPMMVFVNDTFLHADDVQNHVQTGYSYRIDKIPLEFVKSSGYRPLDDDMGVQLTIDPIHYFSGDDFRISHDTAVDVFTEFDYREIVCTATVELDVRQRVVRTLATHDTERTIIVDVPDAEYWYVAPETIVDVGEPAIADAEGVNRPITDPYRRIHDNNRVMRNDLPKLEAIAAFMEAWYSINRQVVKIRIERVREWVDIGTMIIKISSATVQEPVNTVVTSVQAVFPDGPDGPAPSITIQTGWGGLDSIGLAAKVVG